MATVGAYVRFEVDRLPSLRDQLSRIDGVEPFDLDEPGTLGVVIVADSVDAAHAKLTQKV